MLASTFPLLVILTIVLGQHIRESSSKEKDTNDEIGHAFTRMKEAQDLMRKSKKELFASLKRSGPLLPLNWGPLDEGLNANRAFFGRLNLGLPQFPTERKELDVLDRSDFLTQMSARMESVHAKLIEVSSREKESGAKDEAEISQLSKVVSEWESYLAHYQTYAYFREEESRLDSSLAKLKTEKEAVPTPFGSFAIDPLFALLGLTLGSLYACAYFLLLLGRVRTVADTFERDYGQPVTEVGTVAFWTRSPSGAQRLAASGLASCTLWAILCSWLIYESCHWKTVDSIYFTPRSAWNYVLLGATLSALGIGVASLISEHRLRQLKQVNLGRRSLVKLGLFTIGGLVLGGGFLLLRRTRTGKKGPRPAPDTAHLLQAGVPLQDLVAHRKTGVVHHKDVCSDHLPAGGNRAPVAQANLARLHLHRERRQQILQAFAKTALKANRARDAIHFLEVAIALNPTSVRLYDWLARIHGGIKEYDRIEEIFQGGLQHALKALQREQSSPQPREKVVKRLKNQMEVFQNRIEPSKLKPLQSP